MKYYCDDCGMEFNDFGCFNYPIEKDEGCPVCGAYKLKEIPYHETVEQWEARTGREYPDTAPVYTNCGTKEAGANGWFLNQSKYLGESISFAVVATEAGVPTDDWRPK